VASSSHLAPDEKGMIKASVSTAGRRGLFSKRITVLSNDPKKPHVMLAIIIEVMSETLQKPLEPSKRPETPAQQPTQQSPKVPAQAPSTQ
jgi:hypothetical protein